MKIEIRAFSGIAPRFSPELLSEQNGQRAENLSIKSGKIHPETRFHISIPERDYVPGQINDDQYHRLYYLDDNGKLCVYGTFPDAGGNISNEYSSRTVNMSALSAPAIDSVSSVFADAIKAVVDGNNAVFLNSGKNVPYQSKKEFAYYPYGKRRLVVKNSWTEQSDGSFSAEYYYLPFDTSINYPLGEDKIPENTEETTEV